MGLLTTASVAIDGSKFKAVNNRDKNFTRAKVERRRAQLEDSVARYLSQLDTADRQEPSQALAAKTTQLKEKLAKLEEEMGKLEAYEKQMLASPDQQVSLTDPDSRSMATSGRGSGVVGYNVQVAVDTEHHLIVTHDVTNSGSDRAQLASILRRTWLPPLGRSGFSQDVRGAPKSKICSKRSPGGIRMVAAPRRPLPARYHTTKTQTGPDRSLFAVMQGSRIGGSRLAAIVFRWNPGNVPIAVEVGGQALPTLSRSARGADSTKESNAMTNATTISSTPPAARVETAWQDVQHRSFERFCLYAPTGISPVA